MSSVHADVPEQASDQILRSLSAVAIPPNATSATLTFWHLYDFESVGAVNCDGGVLEISTDEGVTWSDAGADITVGGYTGTISDTGMGNPLAGRAGWIFASPASWAKVTVNILPYRGTTFRFRFRLGSDSANIGARGGWWVDDVQITYQATSLCDSVWDPESPRPYPIAAFGMSAVGLDGYLYVFGD